MAEETSISSSSTASGSDPAYKVYRTTFEKEMDVPIWHQWQAHFFPVIEPTDEQAELHLKHPFESSKKGYDRVKLDKVDSFSDDRFKHYKDVLRQTMSEGDGPEVYTRYHEEGKYSSFNMERLFDMIQFLTNEGFTVSVTQNVLDKYEQKFTSG